MDMFRYAMKRLALMALTFLIIMTICFVLVRLLPLPDANQFGQDMNLILMRREKLGYDKPIVMQLWLYIKAILGSGDWGVGETLYTGQDVWAVFARKLPATVLVNLYAMLLSVPLGLGLGVWAALRKNRWQDHLVSAGVMLFVSVPSYVCAFLMQYVFSFRLGWLPFQMQAGSDYFSLPMLKSMIAPVVALSLGAAAGLTRFTRAELTEVLTGEFMVLARAKGLTRAQATLRHALKNAMVPVLPAIIGQFLAILNGSIIFERVFTIPGAGSLYIDAITAPDYNFFMLGSAFYTLAGLLLCLAADLSYGLVDPRIRMGARA